MPPSLGTKIMNFIILNKAASKEMFNQKPPRRSRDKVNFVPAFKLSEENMLQYSLKKITKIG